MKTLYMDINNGVMESGDDELITDVVSEPLFIGALKCLSDDEYLRCDTISQDTYNAIKEEYGIH